ncbi:MAG: cytidine deaminase [Pseudomonadales bacterium]|nr:cytidine deaminase [Pseudomonadales bacterium]
MAALEKTRVEDLKQRAREALQNSYAPYSGFRVAAAVRDERGRVYTGVNVENGSYGLTQCAERSAICTAIGEGATEIHEVVVYTPTAEPSTPCGACRQVISEFARDATVLSFCDSESEVLANSADLIPKAFSLNGNKG